MFVTGIALQLGQALVPKHPRHVFAYLHFVAWTFHRLVGEGRPERMPITAQQLLQILPNAGKQAGVFASALSLAMDRFQINTRRLGNTPEADGDGQKYRGRGLIQITGHDNYLSCSKALFGDDRLLRTPELLEPAEWAAKSAAWFWNSRNLNALADAGDFILITKRINGGTNGLAESQVFYASALKVLA